MAAADCCHGDDGHDQSLPAATVPETEHAQKPPEDYGSSSNGHRFSDSSDANLSVDLSDSGFQTDLKVNSPSMQLTQITLPPPPNLTTPTVPANLADHNVAISSGDNNSLSSLAHPATDSCEHSVSASSSSSSFMVLSDSSSATSVDLSNIRSKLSSVQTTHPLASFNFLNSSENCTDLPPLIAADNNGDNTCISCSSSFTVLSDSSTVSVVDNDIHSSSPLSLQATHPPMCSNKGDVHVVPHFESAERGVDIQAWMKDEFRPSRSDEDCPLLADGGTVIGVLRSAPEAAEGVYKEVRAERTLSLSLPQAIVSGSDLSSSDTYSPPTETTASKEDSDVLSCSPPTTHPPMPDPDRSTGVVSALQNAEEDMQAARAEQKISPATRRAWLSLAALVGPPIPPTIAPPTSSSSTSNLPPQTEVAQHDVSAESHTPAIIETAASNVDCSTSLQTTCPPPPASHSGQSSADEVPAPQPAVEKASVKQKISPATHRAWLSLTALVGPPMPTLTSPLPSTETAQHNNKVDAESISATTIKTSSLDTNLTICSSSPDATYSPRPTSHSEQIAVVDVAAAQPAEERVGVKQRISQATRRAWLSLSALVGYSGSDESSPPTLPTCMLAPPTSPTLSPSTSPLPAQPVLTPPTSPGSAPSTSPMLTPPTSPGSAPPTSPILTPPTSPGSLPPTFPMLTPPTSPVSASPTSPMLSPQILAPPTSPLPAPSTSPMPTPPSPFVDPGYSSPSPAQADVSSHSSSFCAAPKTADPCFNSRVPTTPSEATHPAWVSHSYESVPPAGVMLDVEGVSCEHEHNRTDQGPSGSCSRWLSENSAPSADVRLTLDSLEGASLYTKEGHSHATNLTWPSQAQVDSSNVVSDVEQMSSVRDQGLTEVTRPPACVPHAYQSHSSAGTVVLSLETAELVEGRAHADQGLSPVQLYPARPTQTNPSSSRENTNPQSAMVMDLEFERTQREGNVQECTSQTQSPSHVTSPPFFSPHSCDSNSPLKSEVALGLQLSESVNCNNGSDMHNTTSQEPYKASHPACVYQSAPLQVDSGSSSSARSCMSPTPSVVKERQNSVHVKASARAQQGNISHPLHHSIKAPKVSRFDFSFCTPVSTLYIIKLCILHVKKNNI